MYRNLLINIGVSVAFVLVAQYEVIGQQLDPELAQLIAKGLDKSHGIKINGFEAEQAKVDQRLAKSTFLPKVTINGSYTRLNDDITFDSDTRNLLVATQRLLIKEATGIPFNAEFPNDVPLTEITNLQDKNILRSSVDLDWVLFSGFEASNAFKASRHKEASFNYLGMAEKDKLALKIIETYDKLALVYASEEVLNTSKNYLNEQEYYVKKSIQNGLATPIGRKKIELAQQQLKTKQLEYNQNKILLIEVLHQLTNENRERLRLIEPQLRPFVNDSLSTIQKRNEVKALEEAEKATLYKAKMEKNSFVPKLALKGHYEFIEDDLSLLDPIWFVGMGLKWNIFDGNQSYLNSKKSVIEGRKYREQIEDAQEMISLGITKAELGYNSSLQKINMVQKEIELAKDTYKMVNKQYKNDLASITDMLEALNDLEKSNFKLQESFFDQRRAFIELLYAKGSLNY
ncbi:Outer membrane protein TolC [Maribacter orientalis]|uniref:Outer membrane protein TolC n=1 Tax=Maribacter orientalis TaxID=228957 RepID=A0A1H7SNM1_9FLAO|nr:TolC family protein [Maribacter orientalis]SEL73354.1 Outer membrane protein TolC [Maribacter orientalis]